jgi:phytoene dehydrogenase-like protein
LSRPRHALVVGSGFAGLSAAWRLRRAGVEVTLCEARDRIGALGSVRVGEREVSTESAIVPALAPELLGLARELGLGARVRLLPLEPPGRGSPRGGLRRRRLRRLLAGFADLLDPGVPARGARLDDRSVGDFARVYLGRAWLERRLAPCVEACFGLDPDDTSRLLAMLLLDAHGDLALAQVQGASALAQALADRLPPVRLGARVVSLSRDGKPARLESGERIDADLVLLAIPPHDAARLVVDPAPREALRFEHARAVPRMRVFVRVDRERRSEAPRRLLARHSATLAGTLEWQDAPDLVCLAARPRFARASAARPDPEVAAALLATLPGGPTPCRAWVVVRDRVAAHPPGHYRLAEAASADTLAIRERHRVMFADRVSIGPHIEAALTAGRRAAEAALER